ncbi:hypothetical protein [Hymenobacter lapidiphilus]|uniref:Dipeptidylpeptidase IV N-terminal domain-containing protein n=1 Tax=Hymenobacter lapidiphilus TaxID=2608003 RepID=A0A7Y7U7S7_9BACT|nr:hypothetical protein [Hymenobacter lapidiphilus]NVO32865.1 hypothetical protein [Hymenobacter lapidiphilus]
MPGHILRWTGLGTDPHAWVYVPGSRTQTAVALGRGQEAEYSGFKWLNTEPALLGMERHLGPTPAADRYRVARFSSAGQLLERGYEAPVGEQAWPASPSRDDRYWLIFSKSLHNDDPLAALMPVVALTVLDRHCPDKTVRLSGFGQLPNLELNESPWLCRGYRFVYSLEYSTQVQIVGRPTTRFQGAPAGVYLYDVAKGQRRLLVPGGRGAVASPVAYGVAYEKDHAVRVLDLTTGLDRTVYRSSPRERLQGLHWTPDGTRLYFAYTRYWGPAAWGLFTTGEKLIECSTGKERPFLGLQLGFTSYSWR